MQMKVGKKKTVHEHMCF